MPLAIGTRLGRYEITAPLGTGGMGEVYRARDTRLDRTVALKVLSTHLSSNPDVKQRFEREARVISSLNHPHICHLYDVGSQNGTDFLVMEYLEGQTLASRLQKGPLPLNHVLNIGIEIADALAAAHKAGIVHRDLKPANVMMTDAAGVKLLDFGVAKLTDPQPERATMADAPATRTGMIVGTLAYMAPEQREGGTVDARSDIYSFGLVLFEMMTGYRPRGEIGPSDLDGVPKDLRKIVLRCVQREPAARFQIVDDVRHTLEDADLAPGTPLEASGRDWRFFIWGVLAALALATASGLAAWRFTGTPAGHPLVLTTLTLDAGLTTDPALSADGRLIAFASDRAEQGSLDIWVRQVAGGTPVRLTANPEDDREPSFSPDGTQIAFESDRDGGGVYIVPTLGGEPRRVADQCHRPRWSPKGDQLVCWTGVNIGALIAKADIYLVPIAGGTPRRLFADFAVAFAPVWSVDGAHLLFVGKRESGSGMAWWVADADGGSPRETDAYATIEGARLDPPLGLAFIPDAWGAGGQVLFTAGTGNSQNVWRIVVDGRGRSGRGPERVTAGTSIETHPTMAADGAIAFCAARNDIDLWSLPLDAATGKATGAEQRITNGPAIDTFPTLPLDDSELIFASNQSGTFDVWMQQAGKTTVLSTQVLYPNLPMISRDGSMAVVAAGSWPQPHWLGIPIRADGQAGAPRVLCDTCEQVWDITSDNKALVYAAESESSIRIHDIASGRSTLLASAPGEILGRMRLSSDDRWLVLSDRSAGSLRLEILPFNRQTPVGRDQWIAATPENTVSNVGTWSPDGGLLYFFSDRDGHFCVWAEPIDRQTGHPSGDAFPVWHFHEARRSPLGMPLAMRGIGLSRKRLVVNVSVSAGNIWLAR